MFKIPGKSIQHAMIKTIQELKEYEVQNNLYSEQIEEN